MYTEIQSRFMNKAHGQGSAKPTQITFLPTQSKLVKYCVIFLMQWLKPIWS